MSSDGKRRIARALIVQVKGAEGERVGRLGRTGGCDGVGRHEDLLEAVFGKTFASEMPARLFVRISYSACRLDVTH
jgi:hypothetical protein